MKDEQVIVRVTKKMKVELEKTAQNNKREFSDYMRLLYQYAIDKKLKF